MAALLVSFCGWMRQQRGTCDATLYNYSPMSVIC